MNIYLKETTELFDGFNTVWYHKIVNTGKDNYVHLQVLDNTITLDSGDDFKNHVEFMSERCEQITQQQFDEQYKELVNNLNIASTL